MSLEKLIDYDDVLNNQVSYDLSINNNFLSYIYRIFMQKIYSIFKNTFQLNRLNNIYLFSYNIFEIYFNIHFNKKFLPINIIILYNYESEAIAHFKNLEKFIDSELSAEKYLFESNLQIFGYTGYKIEYNITEPSEITGYVYLILNTNIKILVFLVHYMNSTIQSEQLDYNLFSLYYSENNINLYILKYDYAIELLIKNANNLSLEYKIFPHNELNEYTIFNDNNIKNNINILTHTLNNNLKLENKDILTDYFTSSRINVIIRTNSIDESHQAYINKLDECFELNTQNTLEFIKDKFSVYRYDATDYNYIKPGDVIKNPFYTSTMYRKDHDLLEFFISNPAGGSILEIIIDKQYKSWIISGDFGTRSDEENPELLIKRNSHFKLISRKQDIQIPIGLRSGNYIVKLSQYLFELLPDNYNQQDHIYYNKKYIKYKNKYIKSKLSNF